MPRPRKLRTVCCLPESDAFGPTNQTITVDNTVTMTVDEYETIRLIDLEGLMQEECAAQMNIARTTVQSIYGEARKKIADALVNRKWIVIAGGDVIICEGVNPYCGRGGCQRHRCHRDSQSDVK
ncbi:MAG: DUF134 domain-containing protein [Candidatus Izemoplasmatales bacterium]|jgi:predicted DNA-binding protein (UPF0251 family)|nr:DUF134 domain-containing protein [Candidatus Izemoplasmatales bacterium]MDD4596177.1 DUF134 domain-containing protein [Candidatus Izemoplasmatales bacterium]